MTMKARERAGFVCARSQARGMYGYSLALDDDPFPITSHVLLDACWSTGYSSGPAWPLGGAWNRPGPAVEQRL